MTGLKLLGCSTILVVLATLNVTHGELDSSIKNQIRFGLKDSQLALDYGKELITKIKPLANVLGAFGAFATLIMLFIPSQESAEMKFMREQFGEINLKLDRLSSQLDNVKALVNYGTQRAAYVNSANKIKFGFKQLKIFQDEISAPSNCSTQQSCKRERLLIAERYAGRFNVKEDLYKIMVGTSGPGTVFGEPLLDLINMYYQCDIRKVRAFADGVISLAYKGQYVVLAHEKLTGSNYSITTAVKDWSTMAYNIRKKADDIRSNCYSSISQYISKDVKDTKYQTGYDGNKEAAVALKKFLNKKYPWIVWSVLSYEYDGENQWGFQSFFNIPKEGRKRVLRVMASDNGTYSPHNDVYYKVYKIGKYDIDYDDADSALATFSKIKNELGPFNYNKFLSLVVMTSYPDLQYVEDRSLPKFYIRFSREVNTKVSEVDVVQRRDNKVTNDFTVWALFKSDEQIDGHSCDISCQNSGICQNIPFTSKYYCICKNFFEGENCEKADSVRLAATIEKMLTATVNIPTMANVYFKIEDLQSYVATSLNNIQLSIANLNAILQEKLTVGFQWTNLLTMYNTNIGNLVYYIKRFRALNPSDSTYTAQCIALANAVMQLNGIDRWLEDLNFLLVGRTHFILSHAPLIFEVMTTNKEKACNTDYKNYIDSIWQQMMSLQFEGYAMWAWARSIHDQSFDNITLEHNQNVLNQTEFMKNTTCELQILNSVNVNCTGGYYIRPEMTIINQCETNYFLVGYSTVTCSKPSTCQACNCDSRGSVSQECGDQTGKCHCIKPFYGDKCTNRDCAWSNWSSWSYCGCSNERSRSRTKKVDKYGGGSCLGKPNQKEYCKSHCNYHFIPGGTIW